jgi:hypothetical protein
LKTRNNFVNGSNLYLIIKAKELLVGPSIFAPNFGSELHPLPPASEKQNGSLVPIGKNNRALTWRRPARTGLFQRPYAALGKADSRCGSSQWCLRPEIDLAIDMDAVERRR